MGQRNIEKARKVIEKIAVRDGVSVEHVRMHIRVAMLNGLCSNDPKIKAFWKSIPCKGEIPTPEEFIAFTSQTIKAKEFMGKELKHGKLESSSSFKRLEETCHKTFANISS